MTTFNLVDAPWLPVRYIGESGTRQVGLKQAFQDQKLIAEIVGPSPLATFAIYRLLFAVAHRALEGPANMRAWSALLNADQVDVARVTAYLETWRHRFDLFDASHPFYQDASATGKDVGPVSKLCQERAGGNNATLFDHAWDGSGATLSPAEAAVQLLVVQGYSLGGLVSVPDGADASHKSAKAGPLVKTVGVVVGGPDLGTVLVRNLLPYVPGKQPFEVESRRVDMPAWERGGPTGVEPRWPDGYVDLLTWQSRRVRLLTNDGKVTGAFVFKGEPLPETFGLHGRDPALAFRPNRDPKALQAWIPLSFDESRALWRDAMVFTRAAKAEGSGAPMILQALAEAAVELADAPENWPLEAFGLGSDQAKALLWRSERLEWPAAYLHGDNYGRDLALALERGLDLAEMVARTLGGASKVKLPVADANGKQLELAAPLRALFAELGTGPKDVGPRADGLGAQTRYWATLGPAFQYFVLSLPESKASGPEASFTAREAWCQAVQRAAREAFIAVTTSFRHGGRHLRALALAERYFHYQLTVLSSHYLEQESGGQHAAQEVTSV